jgi:Fe2+ or Zn2+ uptake regulation protein
MPAEARRTVRPARRPAPAPAIRIERAGGVDLAEAPHAHVVCRVCGRIQGLELNELDRHLLTELAALHPDGWSIDGIAFSLTGACRRCREGPPVR